MNMRMRVHEDEDGLYLHTGDLQKWLLANALEMNGQRTEADLLDRPIVKFIEGWQGCLVQLADVISERTERPIDLTN
jgi:hypothetical protein